MGVPRSAVEVDNAARLKDSTGLSMMRGYSVEGSANSLVFTWELR